jgi:hypothetical protein
MQRTIRHVWFEQSDVVDADGPPCEGDAMPSVDSFRTIIKGQVQCLDTE